MASFSVLQSYFSNNVLTLKQNEQKLCRETKKKKEQSMIHCQGTHQLKLCNIGGEVNQVK